MKIASKLLRSDCSQEGFQAAEGDSPRLDLRDLSLFLDDVRVDEFRDLADAAQQFRRGGGLSRSVRAREDEEIGHRFRVTTTPAMALTRFEVVQKLCGRLPG